MSSANAPAVLVTVGGALLVSHDAVTTKQVSEALQQLAMSSAVCPECPTALRLLNRQKFDAVIVDLQLEHAMTVLKNVRLSSSNRTAVLFAISRSDAETTGAFKEGSNFVVRRPLSCTAIDRILTVAYGMIVRERRRYFRCPLEIPAAIAGPGIENALGRTANISEGGVAIKTTAAARPGLQVQVQFTLPDYGSGFAVNSTISWCSGNFLGLQFTSLSPEQAAELQEWLARRLEDSFPDFVAAKFREIGNASPGTDGSRSRPAFNAPEAGRNSGQDWVALYQAAFSEPDAEKLLPKIEIATRSMIERWHECVSIGFDDPEERRRLSDALERLRRLAQAGNVEHN